MINFTKQLPTGASATVYDIKLLAIDRDSDTADIEVRGYIDMDAFNAGKHFIDSVSVHLTDIAAMFPGANGMFEQAVLAMKNSPLAGGVQV